MSRLNAAHVRLVDDAGVSAGIANRYQGEKITASALVSSSGDTTLHTPEAGKRVRLFWIFLSASQDNAAEVLAQIKLGATVVYRAYLGTPGAFAHWEPVDGAVGEALTIHLSSAAAVAVNYTLTEES